MDRIEQKICDIIDKNQEEIKAFGRDIWCHAEMGYKEYRTAEKFLEYAKRGIYPNFYGVRGSCKGTVD